MNFLVDIESSHVDIQSTFVERPRKIQINPKDVMKILRPDDEPRLLIHSGVNRNFEDEYIWKMIQLIDEMFLAIPGISCPSELVVNSAYLVRDYDVNKIKMTNIMMSFRPDVRSTYSAIKLLNTIRRVFLGYVGGVGFISPDLYYMKPQEVSKYYIDGYLGCLNFSFFNSIRRQQYEDNDYERFFTLFNTCGIALKDVRRELKNAIDRMDCRYAKKNKKLINVT